VNLYHDELTNRDVVNLELGLVAILRSIQTRRVYYLVQFPGWTDVALKLKNKQGGKVIFDCMDDHSGFTNNTDDALRMEDKLIGQADLVMATSQKLYDKTSNISDSVFMVKNGTDFEFFNHLEPNGQLDDLPRPIIGYFGAISDWFDADLVEYAANVHPEWSFVLIGSTVGCDTSRLEKLSNVNLLGEKPYQELPGFLYYFDVCTIPFKLVPLTLATNPVKFYEYLSSGKPLVTVKLPELEPHGDLCYFANTKEEFVEMIVKALAEKGDEELIHKRITFAKDNSWDQRFLDIKEHIDNI
jgi:glycosyltransferase involved in cell wall biosynthesis